MGDFLIVCIVAAIWFIGACGMMYVLGRFNLADQDDAGPPAGAIAAIWPISLPFMIGIYGLIGLSHIFDMIYNKGNGIYKDKQTTIREQERIIRDLESELSNIKTKNTLPSYKKDVVDEYLADMRDKMTYQISQNSAMPMKFGKYDE